MESIWSFVIQSKEGIERISKNEPNPEKEKQLIKQYLRDIKKKVPDDLLEE